MELGFSPAKYSLEAPLRVMLAGVGNLREMSWQNRELHELSFESCCTETLMKTEKKEKKQRTSLANDFCTSMVPDQRGKTGWVSVRSAGQTNVNLLIRARHLTHTRHLPCNRPKQLISIFFFFFFGMESANYTNCALFYENVTRAVFRDAEGCANYYSTYRGQTAPDSRVRHLPWALIVKTTQRFSAGVFNDTN